MAKILGYGRYPDGHVGCPRSRSDMTPCVVRDGVTAEQDSKCVGCGQVTAGLLTALVKEATKDEVLSDPTPEAHDVRIEAVWMNTGEARLDVDCYSCHPPNRPDLPLTIHSYEPMATISMEEFSAIVKSHIS